MSQTINKQDVAQEILRTVEELQNGTGFGSVEIILHEGRVTQIEKREKLRFTQDAQKNKPSAPVFTSRAVAAN